MNAKNLFPGLFFLIPQLLVAQFVGGTGDGFNRSSSSPYYIDATNPGAFTSGSNGDGFNRSSSIAYYLDGTNPAAFVSGGSGDGFNRSSLAPSYIDGTNLSAFTSGGSGDGFNRSSLGPSYIDGTNLSAFTSGGSGDGFNRSSLGLSYIDGTNLSAFTSGGSGDGFNRSSLGPSYIDGTNLSAFTSGGSGDGFNRSSLAPSYIDGTNLSAFTSGGSGDGFNRSSLGPSYIDGTNLSAFTSGGGGDGFNRSSLGLSYIDGTNLSAFTSGGSGDGFNRSSFGPFHIDGADPALFTSGGDGDGFSLLSYASSFLDGSDQSVFTQGGKADGFTSTSLFANYLEGSNPNYLFSGGKGDGSDQFVNSNIFLGGSSASFLYTGGTGDGFEIQSISDLYIDGSQPFIVFSGGTGDGFGSVEDQTLQLNGTHQPGPGRALTMNGSNQYIEVAHHDDLDLDDGTIELWFRPDWIAGGNGYDPVLVAKDNGAAARYVLSIGDDLDKVSLFDGSFTSSLPYAFESGKWYHLALVENGFLATVYVNGVQVGVTTNGFSTQTGDSFRMGASASGNYFTGMIDEIRIWNTSLDQTSLQGWMCRKIQSTHSYYQNLVGYWRLDEGAGTVTKDWSGSRPGTLINAPSWGPSGAPIGDQVLFDFMAPTNLSFAIPDAGELSVQLTAGTADGIVLFYVGESSNAGPPVGFNNLDQKYFGVFMTGNNPVYTVTYDYTTNNQVNDENNIQLLYRDNNADTWSDLSGTIDFAQNTIMQTGMTGTEFIVGGMTEAALPVLLTEFVAESNGPGSVLLWWQTAQEVNNDHFELLRAHGNSDFRTIASIPAAVHEDQVNEYQWIDLSPETGINYYLLRQFDKDGLHQDSKIIYYDHQPVFNLKLYPNPSNGNLWISVPDADFAPSIVIKDLNGQILEIFEPPLSTDGSYQISLGGIASGVYIARIVSGKQVLSRKIIVEK